MKKLISGFLLMPIFTFAQLASVFDANYFKVGDMSPDIRVAKGLNIIDVYKPTKTCFITEPKLKRLETGQKTSVKYYYTKTEEEYSKLKTKGSSIQVSYLNMFSVGGAETSSIFNSSNITTERIVINARVDFGNADLATEPVLTQEAKALITKGKYHEFIQKYGTHYISGVKKESSIWITLTKKTESNSVKTSTASSFNEEFSPPSSINLKFESKDKSEVEHSIKNYKYDVEIEINGPALKSDIKGSISDILNNPGDNKLEDIGKIIDGAFKDLSDYTKAITTQYYYKPFELDVIHWDDKKLNKLIKINQNVLLVNATKTSVDKLTNSDGFNFLSEKFDRDIRDFENKNQP